MMRGLVEIDLHPPSSIQHIQLYGLLPPTSHLLVGVSASDPLGLAWRWLIPSNTHPGTWSNHGWSNHRMRGESTGRGRHGQSAGATPTLDGGPTKLTPVSPGPVTSHLRRESPALRRRR